MKKKVVILCLFIVLSFATAAAAGINGDYKGNPIANVLINGTRLNFSDVPALIYDGKTLMPLRACVESVNGIVEWDANTQTAKVIKPETSIYFPIYDAETQVIHDIFSKIPTSEEASSYYSFVDISGLEKGTYSLKFEIVDSNGTVLQYTEDLVADIKEDYEMTTVTALWESFDIKPGTYYFNVSMKDSGGAFKIIAVKTMKYN